MNHNQRRNRWLRCAAILLAGVLIAGSSAVVPVRAAGILGRKAAQTEETKQEAERVLSQEEIDALNESLNPDENGFFLSVYDRPEEIDWTEVFYSGGAIGVELTQAQIQEYEKQNGPAIAGLFAVRKDDVERYVKEKTGTEYAAARKGLYGRWTEIDDLLVLQHGDTNYRPVEILSGTVSDENLYHLHYMGAETGSYLPEEEFVLTARIEDGDWVYVSNLRANVPAPRTLVTIDFYEDEESAPQLKPEKKIQIERLPSDEPMGWYYAVISAQTDDVRIQLSRMVDQTTFEDIVMQEGNYRPDRSLADFTLNQGECAVLNINMPWYPVIRISASCGSLYGDYLFGSDNWKHMEDADGIPLQRYITGHDLSAEGRGPYWRNEAELARFLEGNWLCENEETGEILAVMTVRDYRMADILIMDQNSEISFEYGHLLTADTSAPDMISVTSYDQNTLNQLPQGIGEGDALGDYLIAAHQEDGFQVLEFLQANNGYGALGKLLGLNEDEVLFSFYRYEGAYSWKEAYKNLLADYRLGSVFAEDEEDYAGVFYRWFLYDIDKNDIPELILEQGTCEADYNAELYTFRNGSVRRIQTESGEDRIGMGHMTLWTVPDRNGLITSWGHMGSSQISEWTLKGTTLVEGDVLIEENLMDMPEDSNLTRPDELVENTVPLSGFEPEMTLPVDWYERWAPAVSGSGDVHTGGWAKEPAFYRELKQNPDEPVVICSMDRFADSRGKRPYADLLKEGVIYEYMSGDLRIDSEYYSDLDGDGQSEVVLYLAEQGASDSMYRVILSRQDQTIYAYVCFGVYDESLNEDGIFRYDEPYLRAGQQVLFRKDQSFAYYIP
ncbi:MAG: hypothetical protein J6M46_05775 [Lachnospiraceae bacterium]|nr:hypothetical protein [Lachnospiraceae bacterium]